VSFFYFFLSLFIWLNECGVKQLHPTIANPTIIKEASLVCGKNLSPWRQQV